MMLSLFRLQHLGQDHVFIYLIKIPLPGLTKGTYLIEVLTLDFFSLNSKDYLGWLAIEVGRMGATPSMESIGLSNSWRVCCPPWLEARHHRWMPSGLQTKLFYLYHRVLSFIWSCVKHNYRAIMVVTPLQQQVLYLWPTSMTFVRRHHKQHITLKHFQHNSSCGKAMGELSHPPPLNIFL